MTYLTPREQDCLAVIVEFSRDGISPTFRAIGSRIGVRSTQGVSRLINGLEQKGAIRRLHHRACAIEVLVPPKYPRPRAVAFGSNFRRLNVADAWPSFATWYASQYAINAGALRLEPKAAAR